jgi:AcrR family transcriptional regulator
MVSVRRVQVREARNIGGREVYLDAARTAIVDLGLSRLTMIDVARRAGVSRMTLYRTWPDVGQMVRDLMTREWESVLDEQDNHDANALDRLVHLLVGTIHSMRNNDLFRRLLELDREYVVPYVFDRRGRGQNEVLRRTVELIIEGQSRHEIRGGDPDVIARALLLSTTGFTISLNIWSDRATEAQLDAELDLIVRSSLRP